MHAMRKTVAKGFTLVEILIVVVILGILAAIVVPQFTNAANDARDGNIATQESTLQNQLELYAAQNNGTYPTVVELNAAAADGQAGWSVMIDDNYLKEAPVNPYTGGIDVVANADPSTNAPGSDAAEAWYYNAATGELAATTP